MQLCGLGSFIANKGDPATLDCDSLDEHATAVHRYKNTGRFEADDNDPAPAAPQGLRDQNLAFWQQIGQEAVDAGKADHLKENEDQPVPGVVEGPFDGVSITHPELISETNALILRDMKIAAANHHRWSMAVNDATHFLAFATVQRDEWGVISVGAQEHQKTFNEVLGAYVENYGSRLKMGRPHSRL